MRPEVEETVGRHVRELLELAIHREISGEDHDTVGKIMTRHVGHLIGLSDKAWETFKRIIDESRAVHYGKP